MYLVFYLVSFDGHEAENITDGHDAFGLTTVVDDDRLQRIVEHQIVHNILCQTSYKGFYQLIIRRSIDIYARVGLRGQCNVLKIVCTKF